MSFLVANLPPVHCWIRREVLHPDFKVATKKWVVETNPKWRLGDSDTVTYE